MDYLYISLVFRKSVHFLEYMLFFTFDFIFFSQSVSFEIPFTTDSQQTPSKQKTTHSPTKKPQSNKASDTVAKMTQKVQKQTDRHETIDQHAARLKAEERQRQQQTDRREAIEQHAARMKAQERQRQELERQKQQQNRLKPKQVSP